MEAKKSRGTDYTNMTEVKSYLVLRDRKRFEPNTPFSPLFPPSFARLAPMNPISTQVEKIFFA